MTIRTSYTCNLNNLMQAVKNKRYGLLNEDDKVLSIIRWDLVGVEESQRDPNDPSSKVRFITIRESETEYEYWYCKYGTLFDQSVDSAELYNDMQYSHVRSISFNMNGDYSKELNHCINQSQLSGFDCFEDTIRTAFEHSLVCEPFATNHIPF